MSKISITPEMLILVGTIDTFKGAWPHLPLVLSGQLEPLRLKALAQTTGAALRFEGQSVLDDDIYESLLMPEKPLGAGSKLHADDITGMIETLRHIHHGPEPLHLTPESIQQLHKNLLNHSSLKHPLFFVDASLQGLTAWTSGQLTSQTIHPLVLIGIFMVVFLSIDPYQAGQIRLAHCLNALLLRLAGYAFTPYASLENLFEEDKQGFNNALFATQSTLQESQPNYTPWLTFYLRKVKEQTVTLQAAASEASFVASGDHGLSDHILLILHAHPALSIGQLTSLTGANRNTLKKHLAKLVENEKVTPYGNKKSTRYGLFEELAKKRARAG
jgi:hypothetical protein